MNIVATATFAFLGGLVGLFWAGIGTAFGFHSSVVILVYISISIFVTYKLRGLLN